MKMDIEKYYTILELDSTASLEQVKQAYRDLVNVWHPDRFQHNTHLREKAESKLKELNIAYEKIISFLSTEEANTHHSTSTDAGYNSQSCHSNKQSAQTDNSRSKSASSSDETQHDRTNEIPFLWSIFFAITAISIAAFDRVSILFAAIQSIPFHLVGLVLCFFWWLLRINRKRTWHWFTWLNRITFITMTFYLIANVFVIPRILEKETLPSHLNKESSYQSSNESRSISSSRDDEYQYSNNDPIAKKNHRKNNSPPEREAEWNSLPEEIRYFNEGIRNFVTVQRVDALRPE